MEDKKQMKNENKHHYSHFSRDDKRADKKKERSSFTDKVAK